MGVGTAVARLGNGARAAVFAPFDVAPFGCAWLAPAASAAAAKSRAGTRGRAKTMTTRLLLYAQAPKTAKKFSLSRLFARPAPVPAGSRASALEREHACEIEAHLAGIDPARAERLAVHAMHGDLAFF